MVMKVKQTSRTTAGWCSENIPEKVTLSLCLSSAVLSCYPALIPHYEILLNAFTLHYIFFLIKHIKIRSFGSYANPDNLTASAIFKTPPSRK